MIWDTTMACASLSRALRRGTRVPTLILAVALLLRAPGEAHADAPVRAFLDFRAPTSSACARGSSLAHEVESRLGREVFVDTEDHADVTVLVEISEGEGDRRVVVVLLGSSGQRAGRRELTSQDPSCRDLLRPLALVVALTVDFDREEVRIRLPPPEPEPDLEPREPEPEAVPVRPAPPSPGPRIPGARSTAGALVTAGAVPGWQFGGRAALAARLHPRLELELEGVYLGEGSHQEGSLQARVRAFAFGIGACVPSVSGRRTELLACAGFRFGRSRAGGEGFDISREGESLLLELPLRAELRVHIGGPLELSAGLGFAVGMVAGDVVYDSPAGVQTLWSPWPVHPFAQLALVLIAD